jgi:poly(glycerol-phosphate) alpha-glucosyltransferase
VLARFPDARLDIAGRVQFDRPLSEVKRLGLEEAVRFLGQVEPEQVSSLVSQAHVFIVLHQCQYAGLSFTAIEAMQFGTPVVINAPADLYGPGVVRDGENIVLVRGDDPREIADALIRLLGDRVLRERIGQGGRELVGSYLRWDLCAEKTEQLYREVIR